MERLERWIRCWWGCYFHLNLIVVSASLLIFASGSAGQASSQYLIGVGSYDVTGPAADVNMMGYAMSNQNAAGIHFRLRSRAFIIAEAATASQDKRIVYVNLDACMASQAVTLAVLSKLKARYGDLYTEKNVAISGIHTHSGPGGYLQYVVYIITALGFVPQSFNALVDGIVNSIDQAHNSLRSGSIYMSKGELFNASINRSPSAYLNNPPDERGRYQYDVDIDMLLLKFVDANGAAMGALNWFPVHGTSMQNTNLLISGDNKGAAAHFMEDWFANQQGNSSMPIKEKATDVNVLSFKTVGGSSSSKLSSKKNRLRLSAASEAQPFVAAFAQTSSGDVSPNILGAYCIDTGLPCDFDHSTCNGQNELCIARGPGYPDMFLSTKIIAERQFQKAVDLFENADIEVSGKIDFKQTYLNISALTVNLPSSSNASANSSVTTCPAALGFSFAAGTIDGTGAFNFKQGDNQGNAFWRIVSSFVRSPSPQQILCQHPKPILLDTGEMELPSPWAPQIVPIQILQLGQLIILSVPGEFTTMAGRRLRDAIKATLLEAGYGENMEVVISGLTNTYSQYVTTYEEYQVQRYEGASTLYGPYTLSAYIQEMEKLAKALAEGSEVDPGPTPPYLVDSLVGFLPGVVVDSTPSGINFGDLIQDVQINSTYTSGDVVEATFWSACPRNDLFTEGTFSSVEQLLSNGSSWIPVYDDEDWELRFLWSRPSALSSESFAKIQWEIPAAAAAGVYRLRHFGAAKTSALSSKLYYFSGTSSAFHVS